MCEPSGTTAHRLCEVVFCRPSAVPIAEPATGRLGALDDLTNVVVQSVATGSACDAKAHCVR